jgi:hypothetical protein
MAQQRQSGTERLGVRLGSHDLHNTNGSGDHVAVSIRGGVSHKQQRFRRSARSDRGARFTVVAILVFLFLVLVVTFLAFSYISREGEVLSSNYCFFISQCVFTFLDLLKSALWFLLDLSLIFCLVAR